MLRWATSLAIRKADAIICAGEYMKNRVVELGGREEQIEINHFGIDVQRFNPLRKDDNFRDCWNFDADSPVVISARRLISIYDVESLIRAVPLVLQEIPAAKFVIVGDGDQKNSLEHLALSLGVAGSIKFVGYLENQDIARYLASSDIYVSTALSDAGLSGTTAEAMASGLPVVITDFGDNGTWVVDGEGGFLVSRKNPVMLAEKIVWLLKADEAVRKAFGAVNRRTIEQRNNWEIEMAKVEKLFEKSIQAKTQVAH